MVPTMIQRLTNTIECDLMGFFILNGAHSRRSVTFSIKSRDVYTSELICNVPFLPFLLPLAIWVHKDVNTLASVKLDHFKTTYEEFSEEILWVDGLHHYLH